MGKKIVSFLTLTAFLAFAQNCAIYNTKKITPEKAALKRGSDIKVLRVLKTNGEIIEFSEEDPAAIGYNCIVWKIGATEKAERIESIPLSEIQLIWLKERNHALTGLTVLGGIFFVIGAAYYAFIAIVFSGSSLF